MLKPAWFFWCICLPLSLSLTRLPSCIWELFLATSLLSEKKAQCYTFSQSELLMFWQLLMERFKVVLLFLRVSPSLASSPLPSLPPPPVRALRTLPACWVGRGASSLLDSMPRSYRLVCRWVSWEVPSCSRRGAERSPRKCMVTCMCVIHTDTICLCASLTISVFISTSSSLSSSCSVCVDTSCPDAGRATSSLDLAVKPGLEGGRRRTRRYLPGGSGGCRKTSERFRTQPITANEMEESSG